MFLVSFRATVTVDTTAADALVTSHPAWLLPVLSVAIVGQVCVTLFFLLFPSGQFVPRWTRWLAVALIANQVLPTYSIRGLYSQSLALERISFWVFVGGSGQPGLVPSLPLPPSLLSGSNVARPSGSSSAPPWASQEPFPSRCRWTSPWSAEHTSCGLLLLRTRALRCPSCSSHCRSPVAVLRSHLFDIDVLINCTLVYGSLTTAAGCGVYFGGVVGLQRLLFLRSWGRDSISSLIVASTLAIAALFNPLRRQGVFPGVH